MASQALDPLGSLTAGPTSSANKSTAPAAAEPFVQLLLATDFRPATPPAPAASPVSQKDTAAEAHEASAAPSARSEDRREVEEADEQPETDEEAAAAANAAAQPAPHPAEPAVVETEAETTGETEIASVNDSEHDDAAAEQTASATAGESAGTSADAKSKKTGESGAEEAPADAKAAEEPLPSTLHRSLEAAQRRDAAPERGKSVAPKRAATKNPAEKVTTQEGDQPVSESEAAVSTIANALNLTPEKVSTEQPARQGRSSDSRRATKPVEREAIAERHGPRALPPHAARSAEVPPPSATGAPAPVETPKILADAANAPLTAPEAQTVPPPATTNTQRLPDHLLTHKPRPAASPAALTPAQQSRFVQRVAGAIEAARGRDGQVRLRLSPPELGALKLEVKVEDGVLNARIEAETEIAKTALVEHFPALRDRLAEQGIRVENFQVDVPDRQSGQSHAQDAPHDQPHHRRESPADRRRAAEPTSRANAATESETAPHSPQQLNVII